MVQVRTTESYTYTDSASKVHERIRAMSRENLLENLLAEFPTRFDTNPAIQKHNLCGFSATLCLYISNVSKQVLPRLGFRKKWSDITNRNRGTTKRTHNTKHKIKIKPCL